MKHLGVRVAAASVDTIDNVAALKSALRVGYPMYGEVDPYAVSEATGAYMKTGEEAYLHATGFLIDPDGIIVNAVYSTGPIGRFTASDILRKVRFELDKREQ